MSRSELSAVIARLLSKCLWREWKWWRGVEKITELWIFVKNPPNNSNKGNRKLGSNTFSTTDIKQYFSSQSSSAYQHITKVIYRDFFPTAKSAAKKFATAKENQGMAEISVSQIEDLNDKSKSFLYIQNFKKLCCVVKSMSPAQNLLCQKFKSQYKTLNVNIKTWIHTKTVYKLMNISKQGVKDVA